MLHTRNYRYKSNMLLDFLNEINKRLLKNFSLPLAIPIELPFRLQYRSPPEAQDACLHDGYSDFDGSV